MPIRKIILSAITFAFPLAAMVSNTVPAATQGFDLTVIPAKMELELNPGEATEFSVELRNGGNEPLRLCVYAMDFAVTPENVYLFEEPGHYPYSCAN